MWIFILWVLLLCVYLWNKNNSQWYFLQRKWIFSLKYILDYCYLDYSAERHEFLVRIIFRLQKKIITSFYIVMYAWLLLFCLRKWKFSNIHIRKLDMSMFMRYIKCNQWYKPTLAWGLLNLSRNNFKDTKIMKVLRDFMKWINGLSLLKSGN